MSNFDDLEARNAQLETEVAELKDQLEALKDKFNDFTKDHCLHHKPRRHLNGRYYCIYCGVLDE